MRFAVTSRTVWTNHRFTAAQTERLRAATSAELVFRPGGGAAPELREADVAFGQPPLETNRHARVDRRAHHE